MIYILQLNKNENTPPCESERSVDARPEVKEYPEAELEHDKPAKCVKDVGLEPIEDDLKSLPSWPSEFKILQKEIVELWNVCNISFVHRTYFFPLFQGDAKDAVYLYVDIRRLTFLYDIYSHGEKTVVNGRTLSLAQSIKDLRQERRMLRKQMLRKLTEEGRESLYLKWGIRINSKHRRFQLVQRLWNKTDDMNHIADSAYLVAKLTGLMKLNENGEKMMVMNDKLKKVKLQRDLANAKFNILVIALLCLVTIKWFFNIM